MTIIAKPPLDSSGTRYKQMVRYITGEIIATPRLLEIPVENIFRLMEMYRYDAYFDGTYDNWHIPIVKALDIAKDKVFGADSQKQDCVNAIEGSLSKIAKKVPLSEFDRNQLNEFLNTFKDAV